MPTGAAFARADASDRVRQLFRADGGERHVGGELGRALKLLSRASFEIRGDEER